MKCISYFHINATQGKTSQTCSVKFSLKNLKPSQNKGSFKNTRFSEVPVLERR